MCMRLLSIFMIIVVFMGACNYGWADDFFISVSGNDNNPGTFDQPWKSVQYAFDQINAGDTVYIRGGRYHEAVVVNGLQGNPGNHITITNYEDEKVVIAGTMPIATNWSQHDSHIWKTTLGEDIWQLFVDGDMMTAARWPNITKDWDEPDNSNGFNPTPASYWDKDGTWAHITSQSSWGHVYNDDIFNNLAGLGKSLTGAMMVGYRLLVSGNDVFTEQVTNHVAGSSDFTHTTENFAATAAPSQPASDARYYLECHLGLLDAPGEWFYDKDTGELYVWFEDSGSPSGRYIEGKNKHHILELTNCEWLDFRGIELFAGAFDLSSTYDTTFEGCRFMYPSYGRRMLKIIKTGIGYVIHDAAAAYNRTGGSRNPANLTWRDCEFANFEGCGLYIRTFGGNLVENCYFHNGQILQVVYGAASDHKGAGTTIRRTTFHTLGLNNATKNASNGLLEYNHIYNMHFDGDFSACQTSTASQEGTIHRYNWIHDCRGRNGIRFDGDPAGIRAQVHHVVSMHNMRGFRLKGDQHMIYNLTGLGNNPKSDINVAFEKFYGYDPPDCMEYSCRIMGRRGSDPYHGNENSIVRNIAGNVIDNWPLVASDNAGVWHGNAIGQQLKDQLRDPENLDFRPKAGSDLVDAGFEVAGITDGYIGSAPDIGAYEYGDMNYWIPGRILDKASTPIPPNEAVGVKSDADLMWLGGKDAVSHKVYFGSESGNLSLVSTQTNNMYTPSQLIEDQTYYWRVDTVTSSEVIVGDEWSFSLAAPPLVTETALFYPVADSYVDVNEPDTNYGEDEDIELRTPSGGSLKREGFLKFDVQVAGEITDAVLRLYSANVLSGGVNIHPVTDTVWDEKAITWDNQPGMDPASIAFATPSYGWGEFDVSSYIDADGMWSLGLVRGPKESNRRAKSRESQWPPELLISYVPSGPQNNSPYFQSASFSGPYAVIDTVYDGDISGEASDPDGDPMTFVKIAGPGWLIINSDGAMTGTPGLGDAGTNSFTVRVSDDKGAFDEGSMTIQVYLPNAPDINGDGKTDLIDFSLLARAWFDACVESNWCEGADLDLSGSVGIEDVCEMAEAWLD
ncbi:MAG: DNRLRE domain-containing protein [Phycisphaerae bacterium]|nr:DNRLRE domain-containing protein [Phycisphaerae bacterium]